ncbi:MAG: acyl-CoA thioesterase II [Acidimicrobiales bacterium]
MSALEDLVELLALEPIEVNVFRGVSPDENRQRVFGGQVAGQALMAAIRTVDPSVPVHSLHSYFLRPGDPTIPILYEVDRIRDGRSFVTRRVVAIQRGRAIFNLQASFHRVEEGPAFQIEPPQVPHPDSLPDFATRMAPHRDKLGEWYDRPRPIDTRWVQQHPIERRSGVSSGDRMQVWFKADGQLPDDPAIHQCVAAYASDMSLLDTTLLPHGLSWGDDVMMASLDHAMWFHRPFRADHWLLFDQGTPSSSHARGLARGEIYTAEGELVVSVMQEGLIRPPRGP